MVSPTNGRERYKNMARETELSQSDIDAKLAALEEAPQEEEVEVEPEQEEVVEEEEESAASEDDTDYEEPAESAGDDEIEEEEDEAELNDAEAGLLKTAVAERKKRQESERKLEEIQETLKKLEETVVSSQAPRTLEDAYERDPKGVTENINANIAQAAETGDTLEVERLRDLKEDLRVQSRQRKETQKLQQSKQTEIDTLLFSSIPDFCQEKARALAEFALEELGYETMDEINDKTHAGKRGVEGIREIIRINKLYEKARGKAKAPATAKKKKVKKATQVEKTGAGVKQKVNTEAQLIAKAKKSGDKDDWAAVIEARLG